MNRIVIKAHDADTRISRHVYGHFSEHLGRCIYGGYCVGDDASIPHTRGIRNDIVAALRHIRIPNLRWPGGCFADEYHWKDGIGPKADRPKMINTHWGGVMEDNSFGTHEFLDLCSQLSVPGQPPCEPYICGNVGSGTVMELSQWVEYCNFDGQSEMTQLREKHGQKEPWKVRFWGIGNENWGCGGNMTPEFYAHNYRRYACYARSYPNSPLYKIACGAHGDFFEWTRVLMEKTCLSQGRLLDGLSFHYYTLPGDWPYKGSATEFGEAEWYITLKKAARMDEFVRAHGAIMDEFDPKRAVGMIVDEWGTWYEVEPGTNPGFLYQQSSLRDALVAGITLNVFNNYAERIRMANIAQTVNVLQSLILTEGPRMVLTPTYHVFDMYKAHQDALKLPVYVDSETVRGIPALNASASMNDDNAINISIVNVDADNEQPVKIDLRGCTLSASAKTSARIITAGKINSHNTFDEPDAVKPADFAGAGKPSVSSGSLTLSLPPKSVVTVTISP